MRTLEIVIDVPKALWFTSNNLRGSWRKWSPKIKQLRAMGCAHATFKGPPMQKVRLLVTVGYPTNTRADVPNVAGTVVKALLDGITDAGVIPDDDSKHIISTTYERGPKCVKDTHRVAFLIQEVEDNE